MTALKLYCVHVSLALKIAVGDFIGCPLVFHFHTDLKFLQASYN